MSWRIGEPLPGPNTHCTWQTAWHWTLLEFWLEDGGFETPLESDASQFPSCLEPGKTWVQARPKSKPSTWTYSPETGPWLCGLGACEPPSGWLVGREAVGVPGLLLLSGPFFLSPSPQAQNSVAPCQRCSLTGWQSLLGRRLTICESWPVSDQGPLAVLSHLGLSVLRNAGRASLAGTGGSGGAYP